MRWKDLRYISNPRRVDHVVTSLHVEGKTAVRIGNSGFILDAIEGSTTRSLICRGT